MCSVIRSCVKCHLSNGLGSDVFQLCNHSCSPLVEYVDDITELVRGKYCLYPSSEKCQYRFLMDLASDRPQLHISRHPAAAGGEQLPQASSRSLKRSAHKPSLPVLDGSDPVRSQHKAYEDLLDLIPGSYVGRLFPKASNLKDLVVHAYKKLLSDVEVQIGVEDGQAQRFRVNVTAFCPDGAAVSGNTKCSGVRPKQTVFFKVTVGMSSCSADGGDRDVLMTVRPVGFNESVSVRIRQICGCSCTETGRCLDDDPSACPAETDACRADRSGAVCSGRGVCKCGTCVCDSSRLGNIYGKLCEMDDFSCPYVKGLVCGGHGRCVSGECVCLPGWTGEACDCPVSTESCVSDDGLICSGWGKCVCGKCVCDDSRRSGAFCEKCPICYNSCQSHWSCVKCHLSNGLGSDVFQLCNHSCAPLVEYVDDITELVRGKYCLYPSSEKCQYRFLMDLASDRPQLHISRHPA
ncbi:integrin beta-8-like [Garra rufa]|uniref:integrin beta-8-like n=1 Tax=Garra rufa TaxID=137080 RepID=UPI003CCEEB17